MGEFAQPKQWVSLRMAIGSALCLSYIFYLIGYWYANFHQQSKPKFNIRILQFGSKFYLYGLGILMSLNYFQSGIFQAVWAYLTLCVVIVMVGVCSFIEQLDEKIRSGIYVLYYFMIFIWYLGIMIDYFVTYQD